jgi:hypothetical protein
LSVDTSIPSRGIDFAKLEAFLDAADDEHLFNQIVNAPFFDKLMAAFLGLGIVVLLLNNPKNKTIDRIALSNTEQAEGAKKRSAKPFAEIKIPASHPENIIARTITTGQPQQTDDWQYLFVPELTLEEARLNQASAGIGCSFVYPLMARDGGAIIFSYFIKPEDIGKDQKNFMATYAKLVSDKLKPSQ